jgi:HEAT repeat protein
MQSALLTAILFIGAVFLGLTVLIVINKAWREANASWRSARRRVLEPLVLAWSHGQGPSLAAALGGAVRRRDRPVLERILLDHAQRVRGVEHRRLSHALEELGYVDRFLFDLRRRRWWRRAEAAEKLGLSGARRTTDALARAMRDESPEVRMRAAKSLGLLGGTASARELIHALQETNRWSTIRIADILTGMGRKVVEELITAFPELSMAGKLAVLDILGRIRPLHSAVWLVERLGDPETDVRARAAHALGCIGDPGRSYDLIRALEDAEWPVRAMAAKALGRVRHTAAIPALCSALGDPQWWVRSNAAHALRALGPKGLEALERMLDSPDRFARHQAVLMLQEMGEVDARVGRLADADDAKRQAAVEFVQRLVAAGQFDRLRALSEIHRDPAVRQALVEMLPRDGGAPSYPEPAEGPSDPTGTHCGGRP